MPYPRCLLPGLFAALMSVLLLGTGCSTPEALLEEEYPASLYEVPRLLPDTLSGDSLSFLVYGDTQTGWIAESRFYRRENWTTWKQLLFPFYQLYLVGSGVYGALNYLRHKPDYGTKGRALMRRALMDAAEETDPSFILHLGDMVSYDGRRAAHWARFLEENKELTPLLEEYPFLPTIGNHEYANDTTFAWPNFQAVFDYPRFYAVDLPHAVLLVLDSNFLVDQMGFIEEEWQERLFHEWFVSDSTAGAPPSWLERQLERYADKPFKLVAMHHPPVSLSMHLRDWYDPRHGRDLLEKREQLLKLLQDYNVQVIFSGHEHLYEHNLLHASTGEEERQVHAVVSSGGGVPPRPAASERVLAERLELYEEANLEVTPIEQASVYHYTRVRITPDTLDISTYAVDDEAPLRPDPVPAERLLDRILIPAPTAVPEAARPAQ